MFQSIRGVNDFFGIDAGKFTKIIDVATAVSQKWFFKLLITPVLEYANLFERNLGGDTDVVSKELYKFLDKSGDEIALRPEFTAGVVRAMCENSQIRAGKMPIKLFSNGPLFRYERPQLGRYRQLHQINFEVFGGAQTQQDCEIIMTASEVLAGLGVKNYSLNLNFIGGLDAKNRYIEYLNEYFFRYYNELSADSKARLDKKKALRILDSKDENDKKIAHTVKPISDFYSMEAQKNHEKVLNILAKMHLDFEINPNLVRGLDYYTDMVFEFTSFDLKSKSQNALLGGGRYDAMLSLVSSGKVDIPAVGFAAGVERLMLAIENVISQKTSVCIILINESDLELGYRVRKQIFDKFDEIEVFVGKNISKAIKRANEIGMTHVIILGENEISSQKYEIKDLLDSGKNEFFNINL